MPQSQRSRNRWILLLLSLAVSFGLWHWATRLLIPVSTTAALAGGRPIGNNSDLYPRWLGAREALIFRRDPYGAETTRAIQAGFYGRVIDPNRNTDPVDQQAFAYPLYVVFLLAPSLSFPFSSVMVVSGWLLLAGTGLSVPLWSYALRLRLRAVVAAAVMILAVSNYPMVQGFYKQQLTFLVAFLLAAGAACLTRGWFSLGGLLLALATIKPQISGLFILWVLIWTLGDWKRRRRLAWSFVAGMMALVAAAQAVLPGWVPRFVQSARDYERYAGDTPILQVLLGHAGGIAAEAILVLFSLFIFWRWRKAAPGDVRFGWAIALAMTATLAIVNKTAPYNSVILIPALLVLGFHHQGAGMWARAAIKAAFAAQIWQWMAAFGLALASLVWRVNWPRPVIQLPLYTVFALPPLVLLAVLISLPRKLATPQIPDGLHG